MLKIQNGKLTETEYCIEAEAKNAAIFTTGNGYMGVRGSFEEFGSIRVQGIYVRGYIGTIIEIMEPFPDNEYMKNFYFNEEKLKDFEKQESVINLSDFLLVRVSVDGEVFYPWKGRVLSWERTLDPATGVLERKVVWDNGTGKQTEFLFRRFASYENRHKYCMYVSVSPVNYSGTVKILSGIDTKVKTCGQKVLHEVGKWGEECLLQQVKTADHYGFEAVIGVRNGFRLNGDVVGRTERECNCVFADVLEKRLDPGDVLELDKTVCVYTARECASVEEMKESARSLCTSSKPFAGELKAHLVRYRALFEKTDIEIEGDEEAQGYLRYANYQTLISACDDSVHSLSAKGLTGERYNGFVWWDCEIYQLPFFIYTLPALAKQALLYRYRLLDQSKQNAAKDGHKGAKYAFCSSVTGDERVWIYARHPFLQIHINADIAYGIINYYRVTGDTAFLLENGLEMLCEIARYWISRVQCEDGRYELKNVTGTDEHHLYVDNDAYTNYLVHFTLKKTLEYLGRFSGSAGSWKLTEEEAAKVRDIVEKIYLPLEENDLIPQFDGYFGLSRTLPTAGGSSAKSFQMKQSGLYHLSQIIKQPDVMLLFSYIYREDERFTEEQYRLNWDYYEAMCETASSLSFPAHAICSADNGRMLSFYQNFLNSVKIDIDDLHHCAWQGVHSGCLAGGWISVFRGLFGINLAENAIYVDPNFMPLWKKIRLTFEYRGVRIAATMEGKSLAFEKASPAPLKIIFRGRETLFEGQRLEFKV